VSPQARTPSDFRSEGHLSPDSRRWCCALPQTSPGRRCSLFDMSQSEQERPLVIIAERQEDRGDDVSFALLVVPFYRRRYALVALWLVLLAASIQLFPGSSDLRRWSFSVSFEPTPEIKAQGQGQGQGLDGLAGLLAGLMSAFDPNTTKQEMMAMDWSRIGTGSKTELLRGQLNISAQTVGEDVPLSVTALHAAATKWATEQATAWSSFRTATEAALLDRTNALVGDATTTIEARQAAETALATVRAAAVTPPRWIVSAIASTDLPAAGIGKTWALRIVASFAAAVAVIGFAIGWSHVASAAHVQSVSERRLRT